jgi:hypothetical protein
MVIPLLSTGMINPFPVTFLKVSYKLSPQPKKRDRKQFQFKTALKEKIATIEQ